MKNLIRILIVCCFSMLLVLAVLKGDFKKSEVPKAEENTSVEISKIEEKPKDDSKIVITSLGNVTFTKDEVAKVSNAADFQNYFEFLSKYTKNSDLVIGNLQGNITNNPSDTNIPGNNVIPMETLGALQSIGTTYLNMASGESLSGSTSEFFKTQENLRRNDVKVLGAKTSLDEKDYIIEEIDDYKIGLVNFTYAENEGAGFKIDEVNITSQGKSLINTINYDNINEDLKKAKRNIESMKDEGVNYIIAYMNFPRDTSRVNKEKEKQVVEAFNEVGVNLIVGYGKDEIEPVKNIKNKFNDNETIVAYSMGELKEGNGISPKNASLVLQVTLNKDKDGLSFQEVRYIPVVKYNYSGEGNRFFRVIPLTDLSYSKNNLNIKNEDYLKLKDVKKEVTNKIENKEDKIYLYKGN